MKPQRNTVTHSPGAVTKIRTGYIRHKVRDVSAVPTCAMQLKFENVILLKTSSSRSKRSGHLGHSLNFDILVSVTYSSRKLHRLLWDTDIWYTASFNIGHWKRSNEVTRYRSNGPNSITGSDVGFLSLRSHVHNSSGAHPLRTSISITCAINLHPLLLVTKSDR
jgi:hypothetical protein